MKSFIYFLFVITSFSVCAEEFQIVLDPFTGGDPKEEDHSGDEIEDSTASEEDTTPRMNYKRECTFEEIKEGYSQNCIIKDISYEVQQCTERESGGGMIGSCGFQEVAREFIDELISQGNFVDVFSKQIPYFHDCSSIYEDGRYSEYCHSPDEIEDNEQVENSSESFDMAEEADETYQEEKKEIVIPELVEKAIDGVGKVILQNGQGDMERSLGIGSGFFIKDANDQPIFITNYHVFGAVLSMLFVTDIPEQDWFSDTSSFRFYIEQGDKKFLIKGVRDMSLLMDLAVLEVDVYEGSTLNVADDYSNELPVYVLGYPGGRDLEKIKATNSFTISTLYTSFMVSHGMNYCRSLSGVSGSPALNARGEVIGVAFATQMERSCRELSIIPLVGFQSIDVMSSLKTNKEDIVDLIEEQESLFYDQLLSNEESKKDLALRAVFYVQNDMLLSNILHPTDKESLLDIYQSLSDSTQDLDKEARIALTFLVQKNITNIQGLDIKSVARLGSVEAKFSLGVKLYGTQELTEAHELFQELVQLRIPFHLYALSKMYYEHEDNSSQACRLLTYATEPVEALDDLYEEYECDNVLDNAS